MQTIDYVSTTAPDSLTSGALFEPATSHNIAPSAGTTWMSAVAGIAVATASFAPGYITIDADPGTSTPRIAGRMAAGQFGSLDPFALPLLVWSERSNTRQGTMAAPSEHAAAARNATTSSTEDLVEALHNETGLTWQQLGRVVGVSPRSLHLWARGGAVSSKNIERLALARTLLVDALPGLTADQRRVELFTRRDGDAVLFESAVSAVGGDHVPLRQRAYRAIELVVANEAE